MSLMRCNFHNETYDTDFVECCKYCERSIDWDEDVETAEAMISASLPEWADQSFMDDKMLLEVQS